MVRKKGSNANKLQLVIDAVQHNIENNGFLPELTDLKKSIGYICTLGIVTIGKSVQSFNINAVGPIYNWTKKA